MSIQNPFDGSGGNKTGICSGMVEITHHDTTELPIVVLGIRCKGSAGTLSILMANGETLTDYPIALEETLPVGVRRVNVTGTTATGIYGFIA